MVLPEGLFKKRAIMSIMMEAQTTSSAGESMLKVINLPDSIRTDKERNIGFLTADVDCIIGTLAI